MYAIIVSMIYMPSSYELFTDFLSMANLIYRTIIHIWDFSVNRFSDMPENYPCRDYNLQ